MIAEDNQEGGEGVADEKIPLLQQYKILICNVDYMIMILFPLMGAMFTSGIAATMAIILKTFGIPESKSLILTWGMSATGIIGSLIYGKYFQHNKSQMNM